MRPRNYRDPLVAEEMKGFRPNPEVLRYLELTRTRLGLEKEQMRVLDWGCGRGRSVVWLRDHGYDAYGVDVNLTALENAKGYFTEIGLDADSLLTAIGEDGKTLFPEDSFDFIFSEQVFEHVENLDTVIDELARISRSHAAGLHLFPPQRGPIEGHLKMPFVHWLPKNRVRWAFIYFFTLLGMGPEYDHVQGKSKWEKAEIYYRGNISTSFYRRYNTIRKEFEKRSFKVEFVTVDTPRLKKIPLYNQLVAGGPLRGLVNWFLLTFVTVKVFVSQPEFAETDR